MFKIIFAAHILCTFLVALSAVAAPPIPKDNCIVVTKTEYKNGEKASKTSKFRFKEKAECTKIKRTLSENFDPDRIKKITVKHEWRGE